MSKWSKKEAQRRLRLAAEMAADDAGINRASVKVEVITRLIPAYGKTADEAMDAREAALADGDDAWDMVRLNEYLPEPGELVHLMAAPRGGDVWGEKDGHFTRVVWIGYGDAEPVVVGL